MQPAGLHALLGASATAYPDRTAVEEPGVGGITYAAFDELSDRLRDRLVALGVGAGDRVGICLHKSIDSVATIFGIMKTGAAYVPVDPDAPAARNAYIMDNCSVRVAVVERVLADELQAEMGQLGGVPPLLLLDEVGGGAGLRDALDAAGDAPVAATVYPDVDALAYILYTSGSTGKPKGVMLTHRNALSFVDWCSELFRPTVDDRFSSHAPFHFDLSILDIYVPLKNGATLVLVSEQAGKEPQGLAALIADERITCWYSTPSILGLLAQYGKLERHDYSALRIVNFAGEVFPIKHLRLLKSLWPHPVYYNLYGPTETNVCTWYQVPDDVEPDRTVPYPIGKPCTHYVGHIRILDEQFNEVAAGEEGELCASGPGVMHGYWQLPERTAAAFWVDPEGVRWYRTGDIVREDESGDYIYISRRDRMVKKRGYRVELGEIESALYRHPEIVEAATVALFDEETGVRIKAFIACHDGGRLSLIALKRFCIEQLPVYMVPDLFEFQERLPKTSTDKIDYQRLKQQG